MNEVYEEAIRRVSTPKKTKRGGTMTSATGERIVSLHREREVSIDFNTEVYTTNPRTGLTRALDGFYTKEELTEDQTDGAWDIKDLDDGTKCQLGMECYLCKVKLFVLKRDLLYSVRWGDPPECYPEKMQKKPVRTKQTNYRYCDKTKSVRFKNAEEFLNLDIWDYNATATRKQTYEVHPINTLAQRVDAHFHCFHSHEPAPTICKIMDRRRANKQARYAKKNP